MKSNFLSDLHQSIDDHLAGLAGFDTDPDAWARVQKLDESFSQHQGELGNIHPGLHGFVKGKSNEIFGRAATDPNYSGAFDMTRMAEQTSRVNEIDPHVSGSGNYHTQDSAVRWGDPSKAQLPYTDPSTGQRSTVGLTDMLDRLHGGTSGKPFSYSFETAQDGAPVARLRYAGDDGRRDDYWDIRVEANTGTPFAGRSGGSFAYGIGASIGYESERKTDNPNGKNPYYYNVNAPGQFFDKGNNLEAVIMNPSGQDRAIDSFRPGHGGAQGYNLNRLGAGQLNQLSTSVTLPRMGANGFTPTNDEVGRVADHLNGFLGGDSDYTRRTQSNGRLWDATSSLRQGAATFFNGDGDESINVVKSDKDANRLQGGTNRGVSGMFGEAMGQAPAMGQPIAGPAGGMGMGRNLSNMVAFIGSAGLGLGEGTGLIRSGRHLIENYKDISVEGQTPDQLNAMGINVGNVYSHAGRLPGAMMSGDTYMGNTRQIEGLDYNPNNNQFTRIGGMSWDEQTQRTTVSIGQGNSADNAEFKIGAGTKSNLMPVGENDPRFQMAGQAAALRGVAAPNMIVPMDSNQARWNSTAVDAFRLHEGRQVGYLDDMIAAGASMGYTDEQVLGGIHSRSANGSNYGSLMSKRGMATALQGRGLMEIGGDMTNVEQAAALRYAEARMQSVAQDPVPVEGWKMNAAYETAIRNAMPGYSDQTYRNAGWFAANNGGAAADPSIHPLIQAGKDWGDSFFNSRQWIDQKDHQQGGYWLAGWNENVFVHQMLGSPLATTTTGKVRFSPEQLTNLAENNPGMYDQIEARRAGINNPYSDIIKSSRANLDGGANPAAADIRSRMSIVNSKDVDLSGALTWAQAEMPNGTPAQHEQLAYQRLAEQHAGSNLQIGNAVFTSARTASAMFTLLDGEDESGVPGSRSATNYASNLMRALKADKEYNDVMADPASSDNGRSNALTARNIHTAAAMSSMIELANSDNTQLEAMRTTVAGFTGPVAIQPGLNAGWVGVNRSDFQHIANQREDLDDTGKKALMQQFDAGDSVGVSTMYPQTTRSQAYQNVSFKSADWLRRTQPGMANLAVAQGGMVASSETVAAFSKDGDGDLIFGVPGGSTRGDASQVLSNAWASPGRELLSIQDKLKNLGRSPAEITNLAMAGNANGDNAKTLRGLADSIMAGSHNQLEMGRSYIPLISDAGDVARAGKSSPNRNDAIRASDLFGAQVYQLALDQKPSESTSDSDLMAATFNMTARMFNNKNGDVIRKSAVISGPNTKFMGRDVDDKGLASYLFDRMATAQMSHTSDDAENRAIYFGNGDKDPGVLENHARSLMAIRDQDNDSRVDAVKGALTNIFNAGGLAGLEGTGGHGLREGLVNALTGSNLNSKANPRTDINGLYNAIQDNVYGVAGQGDEDMGTLQMRVTAMIGKNTVDYDAKKAAANGTPVHFGTEAEASASLPGRMGELAYGIGTDMSNRQNVARKHNRGDVEGTVASALALQDPFYIPTQDAVTGAFGGVASGMTLGGDRDNIIASILGDSVPPAPAVPFGAGLPTITGLASAMTPPAIPAAPIPAAPASVPGIPSIAPASSGRLGRVLALPTGLTPTVAVIPFAAGAGGIVPPVTPPGVAAASPTPSGPGGGASYLPPVPTGAPIPMGGMPPAPSPLVPQLVTDQGVVGSMIPGIPGATPTVALRVMEDATAPALQKIIEAGPKIAELRDLTELVARDPAQGKSSTIANKISTLYSEINSVYQAGQAYYPGGGTANKAEWDTHIIANDAGAVIAQAQKVLPATSQTLADVSAKTTLDAAFPAGMALGGIQMDQARLGAYGGSAHLSALMSDLTSNDPDRVPGAMHTASLILKSAASVGGDKNGTQSLPPEYTPDVMRQLQIAHDYADGDRGYTSQSPVQREAQGRKAIDEENKRQASVSVDDHQVTQALANMDAFNARLGDMGQILTGVTKSQTEYLNVAENMIKVFDNAGSQAEGIRSKPAANRTPGEQKLLSEYDSSLGLGPAGAEIDKARKAVATARATDTMDMPDVEEFNQGQLLGLLGAKGRAGARKRGEAMDRGDYDDFLGFGSADFQRNAAAAIGGGMRVFETATSPSTMFKLSYAGRITNGLVSDAQDYQGVMAGEGVALRQMGAISQSEMDNGMYGQVRRQQGAQSVAEYNRQQSAYRVVAPFLDLAANAQGAASSVSDFMAIGEGTAAAAIGGATLAGIGTSAIGGTLLGPAGAAAATGLAAGLALPVTAAVAFGLTMNVAQSYEGQYYNQANGNPLARVGQGLEILRDFSSTAFESGVENLFTGHSDATYSPGIVKALHADSYHAAVDSVLKDGADPAKAFVQARKDGFTDADIRSDLFTQWRVGAMQTLGVDDKSPVLGQLAATLGVFDPSMSASGFSNADLTKRTGQVIQQGFDPMSMALSAMQANNVGLNDAVGMGKQFNSVLNALDGNAPSGYGSGLSTNELIRGQQINFANQAGQTVNTARYAAGEAVLPQSYFGDLSAQSPMAAGFQVGVDVWSANRLLQNPIARAGIGMDSLVTQAAGDPRRQGFLMNAPAPEGFAALAQQWSAAPSAQMIPGLSGINDTIARVDQWQQLGPGFNSQAMGLAARAGVQSTNSLFTGNNMNTYLGASEQMFSRNIDPMTVVANRLAEQGLAPTTSALSGGAQDLVRQMVSGKFDANQVEADNFTSPFVTQQNNAAALAGRAAYNFTPTIRRMLMDSPESMAALGNTRAVGDSIAARQDGFMAQAGARLDGLDNMALFAPADATRLGGQLMQASELYQGMTMYGGNAAQVGANLVNLSTQDVKSFNTNLAIAQGDPLALSQNYKRLGNSNLRTMNTTTGMGINYENLDSDAIDNIRSSDQGHGLFRLTDQQAAMGERGWQDEIRNTTRSQEAYQYQQATDQRVVGQAMNTGDLSSVAAIFQKYGQTFNPGNGMGNYQVQDAQRDLSREQQNFSLDQQGKSLAISQAQYTLTGQQFAENHAMQQRSFNLSTTYQRADMALGRTEETTQQGWQAQDLAYTRATNEISFGWQQEDFSRNERYARGMDKRNLIREQNRSVVQFAMQEGQQDRQESRLDTQVGWATKEFDLKKKYFDDSTKLQQDQIDLQKKQFDQGRVLDAQSLALQLDAHNKAVGWLKTQYALEDQQRILDRQATQLQVTMSQLATDKAREAQLHVQLFSDAITASGTQATLAQASIHLMASNGTLLDAAMKSANPTMVQFISNINALWNTLKGAVGGMSTPAIPGVIGGINTQPGHGHADGGYTGDGGRYEYAGSVHKGEFVVPQNGALVLHGDSSSTDDLLREVIALLKIGNSKNMTFQAVINGLKTNSQPVAYDRIARAQI